MDKKNQSKFKCELCNFSSPKLWQLKRHFLTQKHLEACKNPNFNNKIKITQVNSNINLNSNTNSNVCVCGKSYKHLSSLCKHKKSCKMIINLKLENKSNSIETNHKSYNNELQELINQKEDTQQLLIQHIKEQQAQFKEQQEQIREHQKQMAELIPKVGTVNNDNRRFNIQLFLNESCKDALNWVDFVEGLKVNLQECSSLESSELENGIVRVLCNGIQDLGIYKRPIHCIDAKRNKLLIKDENKWTYDKNCIQTTIHQTEEKIRVKNNKKLEEWERLNPSWHTDDGLTDEYMSLLNKVVSTNMDEKKCINEIAKTSIIPKEIT